MIVAFESSSQDENLTPQELRLLIAQRQNRGDDVKFLIAPTPIDLKGDDTSQHSCTTARVSPTKKAKNHLRANRKALKEKQSKNKDAELQRRTKESLLKQRQAQKKEKLYGKVRSRVFDPTAASNLPSPSDHSHPPHQAAHTMSFSSNSTTNEQACHIAFGRKMPTTSPAPWTASSVESDASCTSKHRSYGKVPTYITDRKARIERQEAERRVKQENAPPAPGLVLMEESERLQTLKMLDENEREAKESLRNIPFSMNQQKAARIREAIEFRLNEIEDTRKIFSKEKVFVASGE